MTPSKSNRLRRYAAVVVLGAALLAPVGLRGQTDSGSWALAVRDVPVADALARLVSLTGIDLVFSSDVTRNRRAFCQLDKASAEALLRCVVTSAGLDFIRLSSGTYVVIEDAAQGPRFGRVSGLIVDETTGTPIAYAVIESADGTAQALSNVDGFFHLPRLLPGTQELLVRRLGYRLARDEVEVVPDAGVRRLIALAPTAVEMEPIVVNGMERRVGRGALGADVLLDDPSRPGPSQPAGVALPAGQAVGVARSPFFADLHIQGGRAGEHLVRLDGAPVFEPVSLGRILGAFSPLAVRRMTVRKAGFGAAEGSLIGGAVDVQHEPSRAGATGVTAMVDPYAVNGRINVPFEAAGQNGALMVAGRASVWDVFQEASLKDALRSWNVPDPVLLRSVVGDLEGPTDRFDFQSRSDGSELSFSDVHAALDLPLGAFRTLEASVYRGANRVGSELFASGLVPGDLSNPLLLSRDAYRWANTAGQVGFRSLVGDRGSAAVRVRGSLHSVDHEYDMIWGAQGGYVPDGEDLDAIEQALREALDGQPGAWDGSEISEWAAEARFDYSVASGHLLSGGLESLRVRSRVQLEGPYYRPIRSVTDQWRAAAWAEDQLVLGGEWTIESGLRATWLDTGSGVDLEPRIAVRLDRPTTSIGAWSARVAAGVYRQFTNRFDLTTVGPSALVPGVQFWLPVDGSLEAPRARHIAAEWVWSPSPAWEWRAEAYHKWLDHLLDLDYPALRSEVGEDAEGVQRQSDFIGGGEGTAWGAGVRFTRSTERLRLQIGYDYSFSERTFPSRFDGQRQPAPWVEPHRLYAGADADLPLGLTIRLDGRGVWGRTWGLRRSYYDVVALEEIADGPDVGRPAEDHLPALLDLDAALGWTGRLGGSQVEIRGEIRNLLDRDNVLDLLLRRTLDEEARPIYASEPRSLPGIATLLTVRISR